MYKQTAKYGFKFWLFIIFIGLIISIGGCVAKVVFFPAHIVNKAMDTATGIVDQTLNANNALSNYESFKDLYNSAKAQVMNILNADKEIEDVKTTYGEPKEWTKDIRSNYEFIKQTREGYLMQYQSIVKQYNSDSTKLNRNLFKDHGLPSELPLDYRELK